MKRELKVTNALPQGTTWFGVRSGILWAISLLATAAMPACASAKPGGNAGYGDLPQAVETVSGKVKDKTTQGAHACWHGVKKTSKKVSKVCQTTVVKTKHAGVRVCGYARRHIYPRLAAAQTATPQASPAEAALPQSGQTVLAEKKPHRFDLGIGYFGGYSLRAETDQRFWMKGGSVALGANLWKGWGAAVDLTSGHAGSIGKSGIPLSIMAITVGPRYRWHPENKVSVYGQFLIGGVRGFDSSFPEASGSQTSAHSLATQFGGGVDLRITPRIAVRMIDAGWLRTQLPNATNNVQNTLRLRAGVAIRF